MKIERREEKVWIIRNKRKGLRLKEKTIIEPGYCTEYYLYRRNVLELFPVLGFVMTPLFLLKCMKVRREGDGVVVFRNKRGGVKLRVEKEMSTKFPCGECDLKTYQNSLCNSKLILCFEVKDRVKKLRNTNFYFKRYDRI